MGPDDPSADPSAIERVLAQIADDLVVALQGLREHIHHFGPDLAFCQPQGIEPDDGAARQQDAATHQDLSFQPPDGSPPSV